METEARVLLRANGLGKVFGTTRALDGVNLALGTQPGVVGLLGPNGAGKTTLLRCLATVLPPDTGSINIAGMEVSDQKHLPAIRGVLGFMPQEASIYPRFRVVEFLEYVAILKEIVRRRERVAMIDQVLDAVDLADARRKRVSTLSGGMKRRLLLAQALLGRPRLLILDEPTAGLDPAQRVSFRELISRHAETSTVILSTHQTDDVAAYCQSVIVLDHGVIRFEGAPSDLKRVGQGRVWESTTSTGRSRLEWRTPEGTYRVLGDRPAGAQPAEATLEDGYLLLLGSRASA